MAPSPGAEGVPSVGNTAEVPGPARGVSVPSEEGSRVPPCDPGPKEVGPGPGGEEEG